MQQPKDRRDHQIDRVIQNTTDMDCDLQGIIGNTLPASEALELPGGGDEN